MTKLLAMDIETACNRGCDTKCSCALTPHHSKITVVGIYGNGLSTTFRDLKQLQEFIDGTPGYSFVGQNYKFDIRHLSFHGVNVPLDRWAHDTQIMAFTMLEKIPEDYLREYEAKRKEANKALPRGYSHREAGQHSLKSLAPYFLGVEPFWENPADHSTDEYVLKDCQYTYELCQLFREKMAQDGTLEFYEKAMMPWAKMLVKAEMRGITLDMDLLTKLEKKYANRSVRLMKVLNKVWNEAYRAYAYKAETELGAEYREMTAKAVAKMKDPTPEKVLRLQERYGKLFDKAYNRADKTFNLDSPTQMAWLLRDYFKLNIEIEVRDKVTGRKELKDSTGVEVLERLSGQGRKDLRLFLRYRESNKLVTSFFPTYRELQNKGVIHCNFNPTGTRTGRLSSSEPNLQQVPGHLHKLFKARPGYKFACFDESAIEARLIAYYTEDPLLFDLVKNKKDIHGTHATILLDVDCDASEVKKKYPLMRDIAKGVGFALFYGAGANRIQQSAMQAGVDLSSEYCREKTRGFQERYESVYKFKKQLDKIAINKPVTNLFGRQISFTETPDDIHMKNFNTLVQSSASDLLLVSAHKVLKEFAARGIDGHPLLFVHDELVVEFPEDREDECVEIIKKAMTDYKLETAYGPLTLETEGKVANSWVK